MNLTERELRLLIVEDDDDDTFLIISELRRDGYAVDYERVETQAEMVEALARRQWDAVIADYSLPSFSGPAALRLLQQRGLDIPIIIVSGTINEESAVSSLKAGAHDFVTKENLARLVPAMDRELREARLRHDHRRSKQALSESEERLRTIFEASNDAMIAMGPDGVITIANPAAEAMFRCSSRELIGQNLASFLSGEHFSTLTRSLMAGRSLPSPDSFFEGFGSRGPEKFPIEMTLSTGRWGEEPFLLAIIRDITVRRAAAQALHETEEKLRQSQKMDAIGRLAGGVAHDFNNLLTGIRGYAEYLTIQMDPSEPLRSLAQSIVDIVDRANSLTTQLLAFCRKQALEPKAISLSEVVTGMEGMLRRLIVANIELSTELLPEAGLVLADPGQIEQVILNLVVNAIAAMPAGGRLHIRTGEEIIHRRLSVDTGDLEAGRYVVLSVSDTGFGIDEETKQRIFEPFFTTKPLGEGTGLGLATVYGIITQSGGQIDVESTPGDTRFDVFLPIADQVAVQHRPPTDVDTLRGRETILLVEDDETVRTITSKTLSYHGYNVLEAACADDALEICSSFPSYVHLLISDVVMPKMSGPELAEVLLQRFPKLKVIFITGYSGEVFGDGGLARERHSLLFKPFSWPQLAKEIRRALDAPPPEDLT